MTNAFSAFHIVVAIDVLVRYPGIGRMDDLLAIDSIVNRDPVLVLLICSLACHLDCCLFIVMESYHTVLLPLMD
jgi:hypothetical protein